MPRRIFTRIARKLSVDKGSGSGGGAGGSAVPQKKPRKINPRQHLVQQRQQLNVNAFHQKVAQMGRAIPKETYKKRMMQWKKIKKHEINESGHALKCTRKINKEIQAITELECDGALTHEILEIKTKLIEGLAASVTDEVLLAEHEKLTPEARHQQLRVLFDAKEWNAHYIRYISDLWHTMPVSLQHALVERLER